MIIALILAGYMAGNFTEAAGESCLSQTRLPPAPAVDDADCMLGADAWVAFAPLPVARCPDGAASAP